MDKVTIEWFDLDDETELNLEKFSGFYALVAENIEDEDSNDVDLLYIGMGYEQAMNDKFNKPQQEYKFLENYQNENPEMATFFMVGRIQEGNSQILSQKFYSNLECLLVSSNEPVFNKICTEKCTSNKKNIWVNNIGDYEPLEEISKIQ